MGAMIIFCAFWVPWRLGFTEAQDQAVRAHRGSGGKQAAAHAHGSVSGELASGSGGEAYSAVR